MIREQEQLWQQRITEWQASGLSGMAYCKQQSLTYCRFVYWRNKLASLTVPEGAAHPDLPGWPRSPGWKQRTA